MTDVKGLEDSDLPTGIVMVGLLVSGILNIVAMVWAGRPASYHRYIQLGIAVWAAIPYGVAFLVFGTAPKIGWAAAGGVLALSIGPLLVLGARPWFGIDTTHNPIFMANPLLQIACFVPFGLAVHRQKSGH